MPPKFKPGDSVIYKSKPAASKSSKHVVVDVLPFTLQPDQVVNVKGLGTCTVERVFGRTVKLAHKERNPDVKGGVCNAEYWYNVTDVDKPHGTPVPSYKLKDTKCDEDGTEIWAPENTLTLADPIVFVSTPEFKPGDTVIFDNSPQNHPFGAHLPGHKAVFGSIHVVADVLPFTLSTGQVVNVNGLGDCTVIGVVGRTVKLTPEKDGTEHFIKVTGVDKPFGKPIPSYELKGQVDGELGDTFWAPENTLTLIEAHDPNEFLSTDWSSGKRRSMRNQSATNAWLNF